MDEYAKSGDDSKSDLSGNVDSISNSAVFGFAVQVGDGNYTSERVGIFH